MSDVRTTACSAKDLSLQCPDMEARTATFEMRLSPQELADWRRQAVEAGVSLAELVRRRMRHDEIPKPEGVRLPITLVTPVAPREPASGRGTTRVQAVAPLNRTEVVPRFKKSQMAKLKDGS